MGSLGVIFASSFEEEDAVCDGNDLSKAAMFQGLPHEIIAWLDAHPEHLHECGALNTKVWRIFFGDYVGTIDYHEMYKRYCGNPGQLHGGTPGASPE